jgi:pseudouridine kinase
MSLRADGHVLVIGAAGIDVKAFVNGAIAMNTSNLGEIRNNIGGVARNIAENLSRLEIPTTLLTVVGRDSPGKRVVNRSREHGINCSHIRRVANGRTGNYVAVHDTDGNLVVAVSDYDILSYLDSDYLLRHENLFGEARLIVIDGNLSHETLATVFELAQRYQTPVSVDPTSPELADHLCAYLDQMYLIVPNAAETAALCGLPEPAHDRETAIAAARQLVSLGVQIAVVTLGENGLAYADGNGSGFIRAIHTTVVDPTGAGDAFSGAAIFGLLNELSVDEAMRLGVTAASLTLQTLEAVVPELSQELLYARLVV